MKTNETITNKILQITADKLGVDINTLTNVTSFADDLGTDSLDIYELIMTIEKEFRITIADEDAEKLTTIGKLTDYIIDKRGSRATINFEKHTEPIVAKKI